MSDRTNLLMAVAKLTPLEQFLVLHFARSIRIGQPKLLTGP